MSATKEALSSFFEHAFEQLNIMARNIDTLNRINCELGQLEAKAAELDRREKGVKAVGDWDVTCQYCNETSEYKHRYCPNCGTKLIWESEVE